MQYHRTHNGIGVKIFWRLIVPFCLACALAVVGTLVLAGRPAWWFPGYRPLSRVGLYVVAGVFVVLFVTSCRKTLLWGREAEEYETLLKEDEAENKR
jgi:hypothetical protein